jgi:DNA-binding response OmpR family regulator
MTLASVSPLPSAPPSSEPSPLGVVVLVEVDEALAGRSGSTVVELAELLRQFAQELLPTAETSAAIALRSPSEAGTQLRALKAAIAPPEPAPAPAPDRAPEPGFQLDHAARTAVVDGQAVPLTLREFELLAYLIENRRRSITRTELIEQVWPLGTTAGTRTVDVHVRRLRVKLRQHGRRIRTLRGHGYRLD